MPRKSSPPKYAKHSSGQARVRINGKVIYLGRYGSPESKRRYAEIVESWRSGQEIPNRTAPELTVDDLSLLYLEHCQRYYRKDEKQTSEIHCVRGALRPLIQLYGEIDARDFSPKKLRAVRQAMIEAGRCRNTVNAHTSRIVRMFNWANSEELVPIRVYDALAAVPGLAEGRTEARESEPVQPVNNATVDETLIHLSPIVADMVQFQLLSGARPSEVCGLQPRLITFRANDVWTYRPEAHKTEHHGRERRLFVGPRGQDVLRPYLEREPETYCFDPREAEAIRNAERRRNRRSPMTPSQKARKRKSKRKRPPKDHYTKDSYRRAIQRAAEKAGVEPWTPNQLRHSRATIIRERYGIEAAQTVLGHVDANVTEIYAERDFQRAAEIMREIG